MYGLTFNDIDFKNNRITVNKQLQYIGKYVVMPRRREESAMTEEVKRAFMNKFFRKKTKS